MTPTELTALPTAEERMAEFPEPPVQAVKEVRRWNRIMVICLLIAGVAMATSLIVAAFAIGGQKEAQDGRKANANAAAQADRKADVANQNAAAAAAAAAEANRRLQAAGKPTVPIPTITVSVSPSVSIPEGLSANQLAAVQQLIENALSRYQPSMTPAQVQQIAAAAAALVPKPKDGHTLTATELQPLAAAALVAFCADGKCTPKPGKDGTPGQNGQNGKDAPPVTDEQLRPVVASGIAAYCGQESKPCQGERGSPGKDAPPPYSISGMDCLGNGSDSYWSVTVSNGTTQKTLPPVPGPCRIGPASPPVALRTK